MEEGGTSGKGRGLAACLQGLIAVLASVILFVVSFPPFNVAEAAYVFAVPLLLYALFGRPARREGTMLFVGGWIAWIAILFWLRNFSLHLDIPFAPVLGWLALFAIAGILALFWFVWARLAVHLMRMARERTLTGRIGTLFLLASAWVLLEWIRGEALTGFPWLPLSASQWQRPLILQIASITGGPGISFILVAFNIGLSFYIYNLWILRRASWWKRLSLEFYTGLALLFIAIGFGLHASGIGPLKRIPGPQLGFVQPDTGAIEKWDSGLIRENLEVLSDLTAYAGYLGAELILWPESPTPMPVKGNASMQEWVEGVSRETNRPILMGNVAREGDIGDADRKWYNAVFTVDPETGVNLGQYYAKRHLVPFGEYVPLARFLPFIKKVVPIDGSFYPGNSAAPLDLNLPDGPREAVGILICYEDIFPELARANVKNGAKWHFVATNNAWYGEEAAAYQHAAHSVLRAVETRRPVVRCGNAGWSGWIDEFGHIQHVMLDEDNSIYFQGVEAVRFSRSQYWEGRLSPYVKYGDWFTGLCAGLAILGWLAFRYAGKRPDPANYRRPLMGGIGLK